MLLKLEAAVEEKLRALVVADQEELEEEGEMAEESGHGVVPSRLGSCRGLEGGLKKG